jgi:putative (di)nucleoside polyphosphate hydrolase
LRELEEEIGTAKARVLAETEGWLTYDLPADLVGKVWKGKYRGQRQKWFALAFTGQDADINPMDVKHPEFDAWRWADPEELVGLAVAFKRAIYEALLAEFAPTIARLRNAK